MNKLLFLLIFSLCSIYAQEEEEKDDDHHDDHHNNKTPSDAEKYGYGTIAIVIVSGLALFGIILLPCFNRKIYSKFLQVLTALAVGTLFSDAILHMIPHMISSEEHDHGSEKKIQVPDSIVKLVILIISLYVFWLFEILMHKLAGSKVQHHEGHGHSHNIDNLTVESFSDELTEVKDQKNDPINNTDTLDKQEENSSKEPNKKNRIIIKLKDYIKDFNVFKKINTAGWIVLIGDALHNFADGLAVGASFSESLKLGISTTIAVVCHEIPHELGNYAVLIKYGFTHFQALFLNLLSATTCIIGFYIGVSISNGTSASSWIFAITAGMFIYIALVDLLPSVVSHKEWDWRVFIASNIAMIIGFIIMFLLAVFEEHISV